MGDSDLRMVIVAEEANITDVSSSKGTAHTAASTLRQSKASTSFDEGSHDNLTAFELRPRMNTKKWIKSGGSTTLLSVSNRAIAGGSDGRESLSVLSFHDSSVKQLEESMSFLTPNDTDLVVSPQEKYGDSPRDRWRHSVPLQHK
ncbi:hypothetical protein BT69DRAFT_1281516 [Atractiella rhizophila]|nr:hypothetical protein BT69DRAFT_1281516 [Atractiella rhizophila]